MRPHQSYDFSVISFSFHSLSLHEDVTPCPHEHRLALCNWDQVESDEKVDDLLLVTSVVCIHISCEANPIVQGQQSLFDSLKGFMFFGPML